MYCSPMGCGSSTKTDDSPEHLPYADRHHPLARNSHRHGNSRRHHGYHDSDYDGSSSLSPVWVHVARGNNKMAASASGRFDYDLSLRGEDKAAKSSLSRRLLPFRRPFYSQHDFSTVTSISDQSKIRISLSTDGSTLRVETETAARSQRDVDDQGQDVPASEAATQLHQQHHVCQCHRGNDTPPTLSTQSSGLVTTNQVEFAGTKIIVSERVPSDKTDSEEESDILLRIKMAAAAKRAALAAVHHTSSSFGGIASTSEDANSVDSICQRFKHRLQQRNGSEDYPSPSIMSETSDSVDWLCRCNASLKDRGQSQGPIRCSCSDDILRRMIFHDALVTKTLTSSTSNANSRSHQLASLKRLTNRDCSDVILNSANHKKDPDTELGRYTVQNPVSNSSTQKIRCSDLTSESCQKKCHVECFQTEKATNGDRLMIGDQGIGDENGEKESNLVGSLPTVADFSSGGFGGGFKRTVSLGTNLTSLNRVPHSATVSSLRAPLAVAHSSSCSLDDSDTDSDPYVDLTTIRRC